jgi:thioredoxin reductase (NADPH)
VDRPVLFVKEKEPTGLRVLLQDLSRRFGNDFDVRGEHSAELALAALQQMAHDAIRVALLLVDSGSLEVLDFAHELHPSAKRVLFIDRDYSSVSPAVQAIALGRADYHLVRPWADDELMYRTISGYLSSWTSEREESFELFRIIAEPNDTHALRVRDMLNRMGLPFGFYPVDGEDAKQLLREAGIDKSTLPAVIRHDGQLMVDPGLPELARAIGISVTNTVDNCDVAIIGAGPAGLTAAVYAASEGLETVLLEKVISGGQAGTSPMIRNYPGFPHGISGGMLMEQVCEQAWLMGAHLVFAQQAVDLGCMGERRTVRLEHGAVSARAVVIATGMEWRRLHVPRLEALVGSGVYYGAAASEARAMQGQDVFIVGGGNSAGQAALHLAKHARTVTLVVRSDSIAKTMSSYLVRAVEQRPNVIVRPCTEVVDGEGHGHLERLTLFNRTQGTAENVPAAALFVMIGGVPHTRWLPDEIARDPQGYLLTGREILEHPEFPWPLDRDPLPLETSTPGVFAAGDVRNGSVKRVASAVGEGASVVRLIHEFLREDELSPEIVASPAPRS